jgi:hypothetical protein
MVVGLSWVRVMVFNATFNNFTVISWLSVLLGEETRVPGENQIDIHKLTCFFVDG